MEERKLNFDAPLLSVRRFSTASVSSNENNRKMIESSPPKRWHSLPYYKSDLSLEQVTEPVAVPFMWEQIPGRPKDDSGPEPQILKESVTPRLPPGRVLDIIRYPTEKNSEEENVVRQQIEVCSLNEHVMRLESSKEGTSEKEGSDLGDDDDVYSDALDTLSPTDSFSVNCSVNGLSGFDDRVLKPSGTFATDPKTRDFMMSRFLPAAKAMALEPPQYASKKQLMAVEPEQPRQIEKVVSEDRRVPIIQDESIVVQYCDQVTEDEESSDDDDDDDDDNEYNNSANISRKACGLLPRLCFKNSLCLLNPMPGLKVKTHSSLSSSYDLEKPSKVPSIKSHSQSLNKHAWDSIPKQKTDSGVQSPRLLASEDKLSCRSNQFTTNSGDQLIIRSSPFGRSGCISPYRNAASKSPFGGGGFLGTPKEAENSKTNRFNMHSKGISKSHELLYPRSTRQSSVLLSPAVEKTVYVDAINVTETFCSKSSSSETKGWLDSLHEDFEMSSRIRGMEESDAAVSPLQDVKSLSISNGGCKLEPKALHSVDVNQSSFSDKVHLRNGADITMAKLDQEFYEDCKPLESEKISTGEKLHISNEQILKADDPGQVVTGTELALLPPPLPKTPSESWLWRTLPSVSSRNSFSNSCLSTRFNPKRQDSRALSNNTKWETIVKTSYKHHDHVRYSEELITHVSQQ